MRSTVLVMLFALGFAVTQAPVAGAQTAATHPDSVVATADSAAAQAAPPPAEVVAAAPEPPNERIYYGGTLSASFSGTTSVGFYPWVAYKLTPKLSAGVKVGYQWVDYGSESTHSYGGSVLARFMTQRNLYLQGEYQMINYEVFSAFTSEREWVPFLLLGGGVFKQIAPRTAVYAEVLFDVIQDERSPYNDWEPIINVGVGVGF